MKSSDRRSIIEGHDLTYEYLHYDDDGNVDASYKALKGVSLDVKEGQFIAILGHNGSGKSTLARQLNALLVPSGGTLFVDGLDTREEKNVGAIRQAAGMVFQNPDNRSSPLSWRRMSASDRRTWVFRRRKSGRESGRP